MEINMDREVRDKINSRIAALVAFQPIYGEVFLYLNKRESKQVPTMGVGIVDKVNLALYYNADFVKSLTTSEISAVLRHEALHILLHHLTRSKHFSYNPKGYNVAADLAINCNIEGLPDMALFPDKFDLPDNQSAEWYYEKLKQEQDENGGGSLEEMLEGKGELIDDHSMWEDFDKELIEEKVRQIADRAIKKQMETGGFGNLPAGLVDQIVSLNKPKVPWFRELRRFVQKSVISGKQVTRKRENRRTGSTYPYLNPGSKRDSVSKLLVALDTSGSVSDQQLRQFVSEMNGLVHLCQTDVIQFDTQLYGEPMTLSKKINKFEIQGRGGTDFDPPIQMFLDRGYDGLIMFTDGYAPFPEIPANKKKRILWCLDQRDEGVKIPYGKKIVVPNLVK
jgi:predicted metal-dependent peptidase